MSREFCARVRVRVSCAVQCVCGVGCRRPPPVHGIYIGYSSRGGGRRSGPGGDRFGPPSRSRPACRRSGPPRRSGPGGSGLDRRAVWTGGLVVWTGGGLDQEGAVWTGCVASYRGTLLRQPHLQLVSCARSHGNFYACEQPGHARNLTPAPCLSRFTRCY